MQVGHVYADAYYKDQSSIFNAGIPFYNLADNCNGSGSNDSSTASQPASQIDLSSIVSKYHLQSAVVLKVGGSVIGSSDADKPPVTPASSMKLIIADTLLRSSLSLNSRLKITSDMVYGTGFRAGDNPTLGDAMDQMLRDSGNTAANAIIKALGGVDTFTSKAQSYGYSNTDVKGYYQPANDGINKSTIGDQADAMDHIFTTNGSGYSQAQTDLEYAAKHDNVYSVDDDANKWAGTTQVAGNVAKVSVGTEDYIIGVYINEPSDAAIRSGDIKNATADIVSAIKGAPSDSGSSSDNSSTGQCCSSSSSGDFSDTPSTKSTVSGGFTIEQVKTFASEPITSTWNIPDRTIEQWFLKQASAQTVKSRYGLNSGNIGDITSAIKSEGVSPVLFYTYTVNEGGGAAGFINHFQKGDEAAGGGVGNAKRDAKVLSDTSKQTNGNPATGGGEPSNMPTAEAKQILDALPSGSIGVAYIQLTSAVTAELEDLSGKSPVDPRFGKPLSAIMQGIKNLGGNPMEGGSTVSADECASNGVTGEGIQKAISFAVAIAKNDGYGYDQPTRETGWEKWQSDSTCTSQCGSFDCSSLIAAALTEAGYFKTSPNFSTLNEGTELEKVGFKKVAASASLSKDLQPGDILVSSSHTEMYIGDDKNVGAHINENGGISGGKTGDQNSKEISVAPFYDDNWTAVYRLSQ